MKTALILLAAGDGRRFKQDTGENKLFVKLGDKFVYEYAIETAQAVTAARRIVVTQYDNIAFKALKEGFEVVRNSSPELGISYSIHLAMECLFKGTDVDSAIFFVCDQPLIRPGTVKRLIDTYEHSDKGMICPMCGERLGNPVLFDKKYFDELDSLMGDRGGKQVLCRHLDDVEYIETTEAELVDIDSRGNMAKVIAYYSREKL